MSIKSDNWIRRASEQGMIEPFEPGQVRSNASGRIVSRGVEYTVVNGALTWEQGRLTDTKAGVVLRG